MPLWTRRLALVAGAVGASGALVAGASLALFQSAAGLQADTFAAGTVTVGNEASESSTCTIAAMAPGDSSSSLVFPGTDDANDSSCAYEVRYVGNLPAWIGLDVTTSSAAGSPGTEALLDGQAGGLQVVIQDSYGNHFTIGPVSCTGSYPDAASCQSSAPDQLVDKTGSNHVLPDHSVTNGWSDTFVVDYALPLASPNPYQGGTAQVVLTAVAVQAGNNPLIGSPPAPAHGWG